ncbi:MAG: glycosyltransferase [Clostridium perfringens]
MANHATKYSDNKIKTIRNKILCFNLKKNVDIFFACSKAAGKFLYGKKAFYENRVFVINNAIEIDKFKYNENIRNKVRKELNLEDKFVIGNIGRFAKQKNHKFLIDIFYEVKKKKENAFLLLIGEGDLRESIEKKLEKLNLRNSVLFLSSRKDVNEILQGMDVFVLPSLYEGLPVSVIEAQTSGLPCIISNKVTDEVNIIDCKFLSITNAKVWCKYILKSEDHLRVDTNESITKAGYDIKYEALKIQNIYEKLYARRDI